MPVTGIGISKICGVAFMICNHNALFYGNARRHDAFMQTRHDDRRMFQRNHNLLCTLFSFSDRFFNFGATKLSQ